MRTAMQIKVFEPGNWTDGEGKVHEDVPAWSRANGWVKGFKTTEENRVNDMVLFQDVNNKGVMIVKVAVKYTTTIKEDGGDKDASKAQ